MNYQTPSDATKMNLSLLSAPIFITYGLWVTPYGLETLSPNDLLMASPCISKLSSIYFGLAAILEEVQLVHLFSLAMLGLDLHVLLFFFFQIQHMVFDLERGISSPSFSFTLNFNRCTLSGKNGPWISNISTCNVIIFKNNRYKCWSTTGSINFRLSDYLLKLIVYFG